MELTPCPDIKILQKTYNSYRFDTPGWLADTQVDLEPSSVEYHIRHCELCRKILRSLLSEDIAENSRAVERNYDALC